MAGILGKKKAPKPQSIGMSPSSPDNAQAQADRENAARAALAETAMAGRRGTMVAGMQIALDDQADAGLLSQRKREAVRGV